MSAVSGKQLELFHIYPSSLYPRVSCPQVLGTLPCLPVCLSVYLSTYLTLYLFVYFLPFKVYLFYFYVYDCFAYISTHVWRSEEGIRSPETEVTGGCEPPCRCWEPNSGPLQEQQMHLTAKHAMVHVPSHGHDAHVFTCYDTHAFTRPWTILIFRRK